jgi:molybdate transport system substrate-binding protein
MRPHIALAALALLGCGSDGSSSVATTAAAVPLAAPTRPHTVVVWTTASMRRAMEALARRYELDAPGAKVELVCAGGAELLARRNAGEPCDVIVIGDSSLMSRFAAAAHLASGSPAELARNRIAIVTAAGNPKAIQGLRDLARPGLRIALGKRSASIGRYGRWALSRLGIEITAAVEGDTADAVLAAVRDGGADAGIVYATSFVGHEAAVARIDVPDAENQPVLYSISTDREAREPAGAAAFRALALSAAGQSLLRESGFLPIGAK